MSSPQMSGATSGGLPEPIAPGTVTLRVASLDRALGFYQAILGLGVKALEPGEVLLTAAGATQPMLRLVERWGARSQPIVATGLYHFAILVPDSLALGRTVQELLRRGWPLHGAADHGVSEALYLADADGNGVEIYADTPRHQWKRVNGELQFATHPRSVRALVGDAEHVPGQWLGLAPGSRMGHVHLRVSSLADAHMLFAEVIGLEVTARSYPGALFMASGDYHHHVAANVWLGSGLPPLPPDAAGLVEFELQVSNAAMLEGITRRAEQHGVPLERMAGGVALEHAGGIRVLVRSLDN